MAADYTGRKEPGTQLLQELEALSESMYQTHVSSTNRRTASLVLPRDAVPPIPSIAPTKAHEVIITNPKPRARRMSLSPWRSRPKEDNEHTQESSQQQPQQQSTSKSKWTDEPPTTTSEKKGSLWNWKPIRALTHIAMQKLSCLFSIEVVTVQNLPASMNGLRLSVCVRKKENKDGAVQTMPSRVSQSAADFEETLFIRCHVYYTPSASGTHMKFEPRPFLVYVLAVDAEEVDLGRSNVDLSALIQESVEKSFEGSRVRQWDTSFKLSGKAKGGELVLKLGFQIMEKDGGVGIYSQAADGQSKAGKSKTFSPSIGRKQSKSSFSVPSPRMSSRAEAWSPSQKGTTSDLQGIDELNLDEPAPPPVVVTLPTAPAKADEETELKGEDIDLLDFDVEEKGVEMEKDEDEQSEGNSNSDVRSVSSEVVKEVVHDQPLVVRRTTELDSIAQQIKALESMMGEEKADNTNTDDESGSQKLDADEDKVTREFLQQLEDGEINSDIPQVKTVDEEDDDETEVLLPDLGKGLGCVVQTRNGGYLAAMNPHDTIVARKDTPKLAMQISKLLILQSNVTGFELFQKMAAIGLKDLTSEISSLMPIDELVGKTAEQIAFEGIASAIIQGREKEGASSTAARSIAAVKSIATAMNNGRKERVSSGIWNVSEESLMLDEILAFSMQKIENMSVDALKIQAGMAEEDAPFDISPVDAKTISASGIEYDNILASAIPVEDALDSDMITICVLVQLRDPLRLYESVGGPMIALIHAVGETDKSDSYKVASMQIGGVKAEVSKSIWDTEKQKLTALQWLVAYGMGKPPVKKVKRVASKGHDLLWSISSRVMADMWLKPIRNPDVKFTM